jgi:hypothetical protein
VKLYSGNTCGDKLYFYPFSGKLLISGTFSTLPTLSTLKEKSVKGSLNEKTLLQDKAYESSHVGRFLCHDARARHGGG